MRGIIAGARAGRTGRFRHIGRMLYRMAGLSEVEAAGLESCLATLR
jgi:hypothetical protein